MRIIAIFVSGVAMPNARLRMRNAKLLICHAHKTGKWISKV
ncbi:hypothetical protein [Citrobacter pasteurii]|nr:hypothetical protein SF123566_3254 [Shigella flexneri 1235-66]CEJ66332.1 hypothetical protein [Citrobacter pasteurii]